MEKSKRSPEVRTVKAPSGLHRRAYNTDGQTFQVYVSDILVILFDSWADLRTESRSWEPSEPSWNLVLKRLIQLSQSVIRRHSFPSTCTTLLPHAHFPDSALQGHLTVRLPTGPALWLQIANLLAAIISFPVRQYRSDERKMDSETGTSSWDSQSLPAAILFQSHVKGHKCSKKRPANKDELQHPNELVRRRRMDSRRKRTQWIWAAITELWCPATFNTKSL